MRAVASTDWNDQYGFNNELIGNQVQNALENVLRQSSDYHSAIPKSMPSDNHKLNYNAAKDTFSGISPMPDLAQTLNDSMRKSFDAQVWLRYTSDLSVNHLVSAPSKKKISISEWVTHIRNNLTTLDKYEQLADRISLLANDIDTNDGILINKGSLATFIMFLESNNIRQKPAIGLKSNGYIDALWKKSKDSLIEIIFNPGHESQVVTFSSDLTNSETIHRRVATLPIKNIMGILSSRKLDSLLF